MKATMKWCTSDGKLWQQLCMSIQYVFFHPIVYFIHNDSGPAANSHSHH